MNVITCKAQGYTVQTHVRSAAVGRLSYDLAVAGWAAVTVKFRIGRSPTAKRLENNSAMRTVSTSVSYKTELRETNRRHSENSYPAKPERDSCSWQEIVNVLIYTVSTKKRPP